MAGWAIRVCAISIVSALAACGPTIAPYSLQAYKNDTTLKADVAALVAESGTPYAGHEAEVSALTLKLNEAYEYSKGEAYNALSTEAWTILLQPDGKLYGQFLKDWQENGPLKPAVIATWQTLLARGFDSMICLEANKQSQAACPNPAVIAAAQAKGGS